MNLVLINIETKSIFGNVPGVNYAASRSLATAILYWHRQFLPAHFTPTAWSRYNYQKRTYRYWKLKGKKLGHKNPLVYTGRTRQMSKRIDVRAYKGVVRASGTIQTPRYLAYNRTGNSPRMENEMTQIAPGEHIRLTEIAAKDMKRQLPFVPRKVTKHRITG